MDREEQLTSYLEQYLSDQRIKLIEEKLTNRTTFLTVVLEDIYNSHNASAVVRTCECFGVQDLHIIEQRNDYQLSLNVLQGSAQWINLVRYNFPDEQNIVSCYRHLKKAGYSIVATSPSEEDSISIGEFEFSGPVALAFGTELDGLTSYGMDHADVKIHIPMVGFTESLNISVGAALCMYELINKLKSSNYNWQLSDTQKRILRLEWYRKSVNRIDLIENHFFSNLK